MLFKIGYCISFCQTSKENVGRAGGKAIIPIIYLLSTLNIELDGPYIEVYILPGIQLVAWS